MSGTGTRESAAHVTTVAIGLNEEKTIAGCINASLRTKYAGEAPQILYVDSGSTDRTLEIVAAFKEVQVVSLREKYPNAAKGRNAGWRAAESEYVQFLDGDMVVEAEWPSVALEFLDGHRDVACVFGQLREYADAGNLYAVLLDRMWHQQPGEKEVLGGAFMARRAVLADVGGFDESLDGQEEPDLAVRILRAGHKIVCLPVPMATHYAGMRCFRDYWRRMVAYGSHVAGARRKARQTKSVVGALPSMTKDLLIALTPLALLVAAPFGFPVLFVVAAVLLVAGFVSRIALRELRGGQGMRRAALYAVHLYVSKYPILLGRLTYPWRGRQRRTAEGDARPLSDSVAKGA